MKCAATETIKSLTLTAAVLSGYKETIFTLRLHHAIEKDLAGIHFTCRTCSQCWCSNVSILQHETNPLYYVISAENVQKCI